MVMMVMMTMTFVSHLQAYIAVIIGLRTKKYSLTICVGKYVTLWNDRKPASEDVLLCGRAEQTARPSSDSTKGANTCSSV
jgi:hypothetical protein